MIAKYNENVENIDNARKTGKNHCEEVKRFCLLNNIDSYHVTENWSLDIMHVVLAGIIPVELGCILYSLCNKDKLLGHGFNKQTIADFVGQMSVNKTEKPATLNKLLQHRARFNPFHEGPQILGPAEVLAT